MRIISAYFSTGVLPEFHYQRNEITETVSRYGKCNDHIKAFGHFHGVVLLLYRYYCKELHSKHQERKEINGEMNQYLSSFVRTEDCKWHFPIIGLALAEIKLVSCHDDTLRVPP